MFIVAEGSVEISQTIRTEVEPLFVGLGGKKEENFGKKKFKEISVPIASLEKCNYFGNEEGISEKIK